MSVLKAVGKGSLFTRLRSYVRGLSLTLRHLKAARRHTGPLNVTDDRYFLQPEGRVTLEYPAFSISVPDTGRYTLHNEIDDCIVCDKCVKVCPVDCIEIDVIKSAEEIGRTSDGTAKRLYAARFDIDMAKCCFCGLCTTVCPTECLTMTGDYDRSVSDPALLNTAFANLSTEQAGEKRAAYELAVAEKTAAASRKASKAAEVQTAEAAVSTLPDEQPTEKAAAKPVFKPFKKPAAKAPEAPESIPVPEPVRTVPDSGSPSVPEVTAKPAAFKPFLRKPSPKPGESAQPDPEPTP